MDQTAQMNKEEIIAYYSGKSFESLQGKVIGLVGGLGAGKTWLLEQILEKIAPDFGVQVSSPTFNLCNIYEHNEWTVHHFDLYRMESEEDLYEIEFWESVDNSEVITFIEWVNMFPTVMGCCDQIVTIEVDDKNIREYTISESK